MHIKANDKIAVFLGPSLSQQRAREILGAEYFPPIVRGALRRAVSQGFRTIGIIDGAFHSSFAISPFEILDALKSGSKIFGAASMGALKAVECQPFGMQGIGKIYLWYQSGKIDAEDEVAIVYHPDTLQAISEPLANMRHAFQIAQEEKLINEKERRELIRIAKKIYFPERTYKSVFSCAAEAGMSEKKISALNELIQQERCNLKALDAMECLEAIKASLKLTTQS